MTITEDDDAALDEAFEQLQVRHEQVLNHVKEQLGRHLPKEPANLVFLDGPPAEHTSPGYWLYPTPDPNSIEKESELVQQLVSAVRDLQRRVSKLETNSLPFGPIKPRY